MYAVNIIVVLLLFTLKNPGYVCGNKDSRVQNEYGQLLCVSTVSVMFYVLWTSVFSRKLRPVIKITVRLQINVHFMWCELLHVNSQFYCWMLHASLWLRLYIVTAPQSVFSVVHTCERNADARRRNVGAAVFGLDGGRSSRGGCERWRASRVFLLVARRGLPSSTFLAYRWTGPPSQETSADLTGRLFFPLTCLELPFNLFLWTFQLTQ